MESDRSTTDPATAAAHLASLRAGRAAMAERAMQPWWYDALLGLLVFQLIASYSFDDDRVTLLASILFGLGVWGLVTVYKRITGFWVNGLRSGTTSWAIWVWLVLYAVVLASAVAAERLLDVRYAMVVGGAVLGVAIAVLSRWWTRLFIAELRDEL
jgi:hypothetical protein